MAKKKLGSVQKVDDVLVTAANLAADVTGTLPVANGGTGQSTFTNGQLLIGNTTGNTLTKATLTAGAGISITNGTGSITIAATSTGDVVGPASATANGIPIFDGTTGKLLKDSGAVVDANGTMVLNQGDTSGAQLNFPSSTGLDSAPSDGDVTYWDNSLWIYNAGAVKWFNLTRSWAVPIMSLAGSPADSLTSYFGNKPFGQDTTAGRSRIYVPVNCRVSIVDLVWNATGAAGSGETITVYLRRNNTTDYLVASVGNTSANKRFNTTNLGLNLAAGDYFEMKMVAPAWATNPTNVSWGGYVVLQQTS